MYIKEAAENNIPEMPKISGSNGYVPAPVDVSDVQLPEELDEAVELIAKNVHEVWAKEAGHRAGFGEGLNDQKIFIP